MYISPLMFRVNTGKQVPMICHTPIFLDYVIYHIVGITYLQSLTWSYLEHIVTVHIIMLKVLPNHIFHPGNNLGKITSVL